MEKSYQKANIMLCSHVYIVIFKAFRIM